MLKVRAGRVLTLLEDVLHNAGLVIGLSLPLLNDDGPLRAMAEAGAQPIAKQIAQQSGFLINELDGPLRAVGEALARSRCTCRRLS